jgi:hypothetical protein
MTSSLSAGLQETAQLKGIGGKFSMDTDGAVPDELLDAKEPGLFHQLQP